ncbi:hypothetical protein TELCIR_09280, partial [Teladorsagia circumcincta]
VFVGIDEANSLWGKTLVKKADRSYASPSDLTLVNHYRDLIAPGWQNGCILLVADKKEVSNARDDITVPRHTPLELFGEEGFHFIEPFLPIETKQYTKEEVSNMYQYYYDKRWLTTEKEYSVFRPVAIHKATMFSNAPPLPPRTSSNPKVTFKGISVITLAIYYWRDRGLYEELIDYLDKTISISKINYNHILGLYSLSDKEANVLSDERTGVECVAYPQRSDQCSISLAGPGTGSGVNADRAGK